MALAFQKDAAVEVRLWARRQEAVEEARALRVADVASTNLSEVVSGSDTVVLCVPVGAMEGLVQQILPHLLADALVTDVGSVKGNVCQTLEPLLKGRAHFIGSHPMAGSEKAGISAARPDLFAGAVCIITPEVGKTSVVAVERAKALWEQLGCRVRSLEPSVHDEVCALISHLPHVCAAALVNSVQTALPGALDFCGNGFRDSTRIAGGLPSMWSEILLSNGAAVAKSLRLFISILEQTATQLEVQGTTAQSEIHRFLESAKTSRDALHGCSG